MTPRISGRHPLGRRPSPPSRTRSGPRLALPPCVERAAGKVEMRERHPGAARAPWASTGDGSRRRPCSTPSSATGSSPSSLPPGAEAPAAAGVRPSSGGTSAPTSTAAPWPAASPESAVPTVVSSGSSPSPQAPPLLLLQRPANGGYGRPPGAAMSSLPCRSGSGCCPCRAGCASWGPVPPPSPPACSTSSPGPSSPGSGGPRGGWGWPIRGPGASPRSRGSAARSTSTSTSTPSSGPPRHLGPAAPDPRRPLPRGLRAQRQGPAAGGAAAAGAAGFSGIGPCRFLRHVLDEGDELEPAAAGQARTSSLGRRRGARRPRRPRGWSAGTSPASGARPASPGWGPPEPGPGLGGELEHPVELGTPIERIRRCPALSVPASP